MVDGVGVGVDESWVADVEAGAIEFSGGGAEVASDGAPLIALRNTSLLTTFSPEVSSTIDKLSNIVASNTSPAIDLASSAFSVGGISTEEAAPMLVEVQGCCCCWFAEK